MTTETMYKWEMDYVVITIHQRTDDRIPIKKMKQDIENLFTKVKYVLDGKNYQQFILEDIYEEKIFIDTSYRKWTKLGDITVIIRYIGLLNKPITQWMEKLLDSFLVIGIHRQIISRIVMGYKYNTTF